MKLWLQAPSFWPEARDPWAWQRALIRLVEKAPLPDPRPCWEQYFKGRLSRRALPGLYGLRARPAPARLLGLGLLQANPRGWVPTPLARNLVHLARAPFQEELARLLIQRSPWVRLALLGLKQGIWSLPRGTVPLRALRQMRVGHDLLVPDNLFDNLPHPAPLLGQQFGPHITELDTTAPPASLSALHGPLHLLHALSWLSENGCPQLPAGLARELMPVDVAATLRECTGHEQDHGGFVAFNMIATWLWRDLFGTAPQAEFYVWSDRIFAEAIEAGHIEIHEWAPGQPRHGRGFLGDPNRQLVRWSIHDDFNPLRRDTDLQEVCS